METLEAFNQISKFDHVTLKYFFNKVFNLPAVLDQKEYSIYVRSIASAVSLGLCGGSIGSQSSDVKYFTFGLMTRCYNSNQKIALNVHRIFAIFTYGLLPHVSYIDMDLVRHFMKKLDVTNKNLKKYLMHSKNTKYLKVKNRAIFPAEVIDRFSQTDLLNIKFQL